MKVTITHLKAPWPAEAKVGDVVDLVGVSAVPDWAAGKCTPADGDAKAAHSLKPRKLEPSAREEAEKAAAGKAEK